MDDKKFTEAAATLYPQIYHRLHTRWQKDEYRPSAEALAILTHLQLSGPLTISEAAEHFDRAQSAMSEIIDRMEAQAVIERIKDSRDRRRTLIWLSERGMRLLQKSQSVLDVERLQQCAAQMSESEREHLISGFKALLNAFEVSVKQEK